MEGVDVSSTYSVSRIRRSIHMRPATFAKNFNHVTANFPFSVFIWPTLAITAAILQLSVVEYAEWPFDLHYSLRNPGTVELNPVDFSTPDAGSFDPMSFVVLGLVEYIIRNTDNMRN